MKTELTVCAEQNGRAMLAMSPNSKGDAHQPQVRAQTAPSETLPERALSRLCIVAVQSRAAAAAAAAQLACVPSSAESGAASTHAPARHSVEAHWARVSVASSSAASPRAGIRDGIVFEAQTQPKDAPETTHVSPRHTTSRSIEVARRRGGAERPTVICPPP